MWHRDRASWRTCALVVVTVVVTIAPAGRQARSEANALASETPQQVVPTVAASADLPGDQTGKQAASATPRSGKQAQAGLSKMGVLPAFAPVRATLEPRVREAYERAELRASESWPRCRLRWTLLAAIGAVESANGAHTAGSIVLIESGRVLPLVIGPVLDSTAGTMAVRDTDGGALDGDTVWDHAVGPMQFLPSTWARLGRDANGDGRADPHSIDDAALTAATYVCAGERDLSVAAELDAAIYSYNRSDSYVAAVRAHMNRFDLEFGYVSASGDPHALTTEKPGSSVADAPGRTTSTTSTTTSVGPTSTTTSVGPTSTSRPTPTTTMPRPSTPVAPTTTTSRTPVVTTTVVPPTSTTTATTTTTAPALDHP